MVTLAVLGACAEPGGDIQTEYYKVARRTGIVPVFPPKEDIQVGDFYALSFGGPNDVLREWIGNDPRVLDHAQDYMQSRLVFRPTVANNSAFVDNAAGQTDTYGPAFAQRSAQRIESLPIEALPDVTTDASAAFGFGVSNPLSAIGLSVGSRTRVRVDFGDVRSYGLPRVRLTQRGYDPRMAALNANLRSGPDVNFDYIQLALDNQYQAAVSADRPIAPRDERCRATALVTKVYLTRKITFTFIDARAGALQASEIQKGVTEAQTINVPPININLTTGNGPDQSDLQETTDAIATEIAEVTPSDEGMSRGLAFEGFTALGAQFSQTYQRPVVVGYETWPFNEDIPDDPEETARCQDLLQL